MDINELRQELAACEDILRKQQANLAQTNQWIERLGRSSFTIEALATTAAAKLEQNPGDAEAKKILLDCERLVLKIKETFDQYILKRDQEQVSVERTTNLKKDFERTILEWGIDPNG